MRRRLRGRLLGTAALVAAAVVIEPTPPVQAIDPGDLVCPQTSPNTDHQGEALQQFAGNGENGVVYSPATQSLKLARTGGVFRATNLPITDLPSFVCTADFDEDGWTDFVGAAAFNTFIKLYKNRTFDNPEPDWQDPNAVRAPKFTTPYPNIQDTTSTTSSYSAHRGTTACGDFDGDGHADFMFISRNRESAGTPTRARLWRGRGDGTFHSPYQFVAQLEYFDYTSWANRGVVTDYNGDGRLDVIIGLATGSSSGGKVQVFLNDGGSPPMFTPSVTLLSNAGMGYRGSHEVAYADFTGDGIKDLIASGASTTRLRLYPGLAGGGVDTANYQSIPFPVGSAATLMFGDFTLDGRPDIVVGTDNYNLGCGTSTCDAHTGGYTYVYRNNGTATPFSGGVSQTLTQHDHSSTFDFDVGAAFNYDNDPDSTIDFLIADGNDSGNYYVFANRVITQYVDCGEVASGVLDLGPLADDEMVISGARLQPDVTVPSGTSITFYMSNETPENWQLANPCADDPSEYCVSFPNPAGREVRWKAEMCSNLLRTETPEIRGVTLSFDYTPAEQHLRGGVVVHDGVVYAGAFKQPGDRGHFYAMNAGLNHTYWDAAALLDAMSDSARHMYTATADGRERLDFSTAATSDPRLLETLGVATQAQAAEVIAWQRSARFGLSGGGFERTRLGSVEQSTPAVLSPPGYPIWYDFLDPVTRQKFDSFMAEHANRPILVLFGSKDGALHAIRTDPQNITGAASGTEAWAFVPARVAGRLVADMTSGVVTAYPDGSPTLADVLLADGEVHTVALVGGGSGGRSVFALDVTRTVEPSTGATIGPIPLWEIIPGEGSAGLGRAKPAIARVRIGGQQRFIAILGTGIAPENPAPPYSKGRDVVAVDIGTGERLWRFRAACPLTSDLVVFETDDDLEPGAPVIDGFADRVVFADACGFVYKLDPAVELEGNEPEDGWLSSEALGAIDTGEVDPAGRPIKALFSTRLTAGALGRDAPIAGTIGSRPDETGRVVLFFGTGGIESYDPSLPNEFYAVHAEDGSIRQKVTGTCDSRGCEKFYGGVVVSPEQVFMTRAVDPPIGTSVCDLGSAEVAGLDLDTLGAEFTQTTSSATVSALFGHAGAIYLTTLGGQIVRIGEPVAGEAGGESGAGGEGNNPPPIGGSGALQILGWWQSL